MNVLCFRIFFLLPENDKMKKFNQTFLLNQHSIMDIHNVIDNTQ